MKTKTSSCLAALVVAAFICGTATAATVIVPNGTTDWTTLGLVAADTARLDANTTVYVNDLASLLVVSNLTQVTFYGYNASKIVFNVPENESWGVNCTIRYSDSGIAYGHLVKRGKGTLRLLKGASNQEAPYNCHITVEEGSLAMPENLQYTGTSTYTGLITVSNGASFFAPGFSDASKTWKWFARGFAGDGLITNASSHSVTVGLYLHGKNWVWDGKTYDFGGSFHGAFAFSTSNMRQFFSGTNSMFTSFGTTSDDGNYSAGEGTIGVMKFGEPGERSSIGTSSYIRWAGGGGYLYLGEGETSSKELQFQENGHPFIDGGTHGGLVFTSALVGNISSHVTADKTVTLMGSNTTACALSGKIPSWSQSSVPYTFHIVKKGPGAWRLDYPLSTMKGKITVEEGLLGFSRLLEKGWDSSFGTATGSAAAETAIALGSEGKEGGIGLLEAGGRESRSTTRPIALVGDGRLVNNSTNALSIGKIRVVNSSGATLALDGTNTQSVVYDLADGEGPLSLVKDGAGTWYLSGSNTFSGTIDVNAGTLVFSSNANKNFTWYKFVVKKMMGATTTTMSLAELGLYDSNDDRINSPVTISSDDTFLVPGQAAYVRPITGSQSGQLANLFDDNQVPWTAIISGVPDPANEATWLTVIMRPQAGSNPAVSWDIAAGARGELDPGCGNSSNSYPRVCAIMGSVDGVHYELLGEETISFGSEYRAWASTKKKNASESAHHPGGFQLDRTTPSAASPMPTNSVVSVASNATLRAEGEHYTLSNLKISAAGAGTIDGFDFAATGTLSVVDWTNGVITLPMTFSNCTGLKNLRNWTLTVNGAASNYRICVSGSTVQLIPPGFLVIFQ